jgi:hypothetical protein
MFGNDNPRWRGRRCSSPGLRPKSSRGGDTDRSVANLLEHLRDETTDENALKALLGRFLMHGLMCEDDGTFLSLALPKQQGL